MAGRRIGWALMTDGIRYAAPCSLRPIPYTDPTHTHGRAYDLPSGGELGRGAFAIVRRCVLRAAPHEERAAKVRIVL